MGEPGPGSTDDRSELATRVDPHPPAFASRAPHPVSTGASSALARGEDTVTARDGGPARSSRPPPVLRLEPGALVAGRYRVVRPIAAGGYGEVLEVADERTGRAVALKLHHLASRAVSAASALRGEFAILCGLHHPNLADVYDYGYVGETAYFTQALVPGVRLDRAGLDLADPSSLDLLAQLCRALDYLHARGLLHRDVKPANVIVDRERGRLVLLDFGIARAFGHADRRVVVGTHAYLSPEAIRGQPLDARSDLYSLGVTLYRIASGRVPFPLGEREPDDVLLDHLTSRPPPLPGSVPRAVAEVIERLLEKEPAARFASAGEVIDALGRALGRALARDTPETLASYVLSAAYVEQDGLLHTIEAHALAADPARPLLLIGEAGTGKSRALRELRHRAQIRGAAWIPVASRAEATPGGALRELAEALLTPEIVARLGDEDRLELARAVPALRRRGERIAIPVDPERSARLRLEALGRLLALRFRSRAGVVVVDDVHRSEPELGASIALLAAVAAREGARCAIIASGRPGPSADAFARTSGAAVARCEPLGPDASRALVATTFGRSDLLEGTALGDALARRPHPAQEVQEALRLACELGEISRNSGMFRVTAAIPSRAARDVIAARVARLRDDARAIALACAVWSAPATASEIARVSGRSLSRAGAGLRQLVGAGILEEDRDARERVTYEMHDRYAEIVRTLFPSDELHATHLRAARVHLRAEGDPRALAAGASHLLAARDRGGARDAFLAAAGAWERSGRPDLALRLVERALALPPVDADREKLALHLRRHDLAVTCGAKEEAARSLAWLARRAEAASPEQRVEILLRRARHASREGEGTRAQRVLRRALSIAHASRDLFGQTHARLLGGDVEWVFGTMDRALAEFRAAAAIAAATGDRGAEARGWLGASLACVHLGRNGDALETAQHAARAASDSTDLALRSDAQRQLGNVTRELGRNATARAHYGRAVRAARACGCLEREAKALNNLGTVAHWLGDVDGAMEAYRRSIALKERAGATASARVGHNNVGALQLAVGQFAEARATLEPLTREGPTELVLVRSIALSNLGDLEAMEGALDLAIERYRGALEACRARSFATQQSHSLTSLARVLLMRSASGDLEEARDLVRELGALARERDMAEANRRWHATSAMLASYEGDDERAIDEARLAIAAPDRVTRFSDLFSTPIEVHWILALALAHAGRDGAARRAAERARRELLRDAALLRSDELRSGFLEKHRLHRAIALGDLGVPRGWTWAP